MAESWAQLEERYWLWVDVTAFRLSEHFHGRQPYVFTCGVSVLETYLGNVPGFCEYVRLFLFVLWRSYGRKYSDVTTRL